MDRQRTPGSRPPHRPQNSHALPRSTLPKKLQLFFAPRMPIPYLPPMKKKKPALPYTGVAQYVCHFEEKKEEEEKENEERRFRNPEFAAQCRVKAETKAEKKARLRNTRVERNNAKTKAAGQHWDPMKDEKIQGDPFKTLFLARVSYKVSENELKTVFGEYGPIRNVRIVRDATSGKSRGYAFIEFEHTSDMKEAYKNADGVKIEGRRVLVDVERGRTMEGWRPARLGGGLGAQSRKPKKAQRHERPTTTARDERQRGESSRADHRSRDHTSGRSSDRRSRSDYSRREGEYRERERDHGLSGRRRYDNRYERERSSRYDKRYRVGPPTDNEDRPGKKKRELEEGELDSRDVKETRRRERDMM